MSTTILDGIYIECTQNGDKQETYFAIYKKQKTLCLAMENYLVNRESIV
ncbi:DUF6275 family protein [uncultured Anaerococcus sp.]|nr:DUF6275 family protein [uncultured Anaerococcus sp.]